MDRSKTRIILTVNNWMLSVKGDIFTISCTDVTISPKTFKNIVEALEYFVGRIKK